MDIERFVILPAGTYFFGDPNFVLSGLDTRTLHGEGWDKFLTADFEGLTILNIGTEQSPLNVVVAGADECHVCDTDERVEFVVMDTFGLINLEQVCRTLGVYFEPLVEFLSWKPSHGLVFTADGPVTLSMPSPKVFVLEYDGLTLEVHAIYEDQ